MISVIIPVYNVEKQLSRCLDSLLAQTWTDWEAICVDDGSRDKSPEILDTYARKDARIKVQHITNGGVSNARNIALEQIRGEYLIMIDSDDFIHPQTFEICIKSMERDISDAATFTYSRSYRTRTLLRQSLHIPEYMPRFREYDIDSIETKTSDNIFEWATEYSHSGDIDSKWAIKHCQPWRVMLRAERVRDIKFITGIIYEDFPWWSEVMLRIRRVTILNLPLYYYYPNFKGYIISSSQDYRIESLRKAIEYAKDVYETQADSSQKRLWEKNFLVPFMEKLKKKEKKS